MEVGGYKLAISTPHLLTLSLGPFSRILALHIFGEALVHGEIVVIYRGDLIESKNARNASNVGRIQTDLGEGLHITETKVVADAPVILKNLLAGHKPRGEGDLVPGSTEALGGGHFATKQRAAHTHHKRTVRRSEAYSGSRTADHTESVSRRLIIY